MSYYTSKPFHLQILDRSRDQFADLTALTDEEGTLTFRQLREYSYKFASLLQERNLKKGDSILLVLSNSRWFPVIFLGSALLGIPISAIHTQSTSSEIEQAIETCGAKFVIAETAMTSIEKPSSTLTEVITKLETLELLDGPFPDISLDDVLIMPFSSGTTGKPKCVVLTHRNYNAATTSLKEGLFDALLEHSDRKNLAVLPFHHGSGFWALLFCLLEGCHTIILKNFNPLVMLQMIEKYQIDVINVVPAIVSALCRLPTSSFQLSCLKTVLCGSAPLGKELTALFYEKFPSVENFIQGYGMTEIVVLSHIRSYDCERFEKLGSCGKLLPHFEAKIVRDDGSLVTGTQESGELLLRSDAVTKRYLHQELPVDEEGYMRTGDVVYRDDDGYYFVVDRVKDLIKVNGMQVSPSEVEDILLRHCDVAAAAVIGIPHRNSGEVPKAFVILKEGVSRDGVEKELLLLVKEKAAPHKHLKGGVAIVESLPLTSSGKVNRRQLRDDVRAAMDGPL